LPPLWRLANRKF